MFTIPSPTFADINRRLLTLWWHTGQLTMDRFTRLACCLPFPVYIPLPLPPHTCSFPPFSLASLPLPLLLPSPPLDITWRLLLYTHLGNLIPLDCPSNLQTSLICFSPSSLLCLHTSLFHLSPHYALPPSLRVYPLRNYHEHCRILHKCERATQPQHIPCPLFSLVRFSSNRATPLDEFKMMFSATPSHPLPYLWPLGRNGGRKATTCHSLLVFFPSLRQ